MPTDLSDKFTGYDYGVFVGMLVCSGTIGLFCAFYGGGQSTVKQLLRGSQNLPVLPVSMSLMGSFISAAYILGNSSEIYQNGTMFYMILLSYCLVIPATAFLYLPIFFNLNVTTAYEYLELRFKSRPLRVIAVILYTIQMAIYISISLYAPALAMSQLTGIGLWTAVVALGIVCTVYTSIGGIKAVVFTDTFQGCMMFIALLTVIITATSRLGGISHVWEVARRGKRIQFNEWNPDPTVRHTFWGLCIGGYFTNAASYATNQMMVIRYTVVSTLNRAKTVVWLNLPLLCLVLSLSCMTGLLVYTYFAECDPISVKEIESTDQLLPYFVMRVLGDMKGMPGLFVAGIFAASLSSISSGVNSLASVFYIDVIALAKPGLSEKTGCRIITALGVFFGLLSIGLVALAEQMGSVLQASVAINGGIGGPLLGVFTLGMFIPWANWKGGMAGLLVSLVLSLWINLGSFINMIPEKSPPLSVDGCIDLYMNVTNSSIFIPPTSATLDNLPQSMDAYRLSYMWYSACAFLIVFIVGLPVSYFTTPDNPDNMNPQLICPVVDIMFWYLPDSFRKRFRFSVGKNYVPPEQPREPTELEQKTDEVLKKDNIINVSYIKTLTDASFPVAPPLRKVSYHRNVTPKDVSNS